MSLGTASGAITLDTSGIDRAVAQIRAGMLQAERSMEGAGVVAGRAGQSVSDGLARAGQSVDRLKAAINLQQRQFALLTQEVERTGQVYGTSSLQAQKKQLALDKLSQSIENNRTRLQQARSDVQRFSEQLQVSGSGAGSLVNRFSSLQAGLTSLLPALTAVGVAFAIDRQIRAAVGAAADFEAAMTRVGAVSNASVGELQRLTDVARDLGATTVFSASQAAEGMQYLAMAGFSVNEIVDAMPGLLDAAAAAQMDLGRAADITSNVLTGFGLSAGEAGRVADVLVFASNNANTTIEQLGLAMTYAAPIAASLGVSLEDTTAAIAAMSNAGIQGEKAGTALRGAMIRLSAPTGNAAQEIARLNLDLFDAGGSLKALPDVIAEFEQALAGMTDQQRMAALQTIVGTEAASGFLALLTTGSSGVNAFSEALERSGGTAARVAAEQMDTLKGATQSFNSALESLRISLGDRAVPGLTALTRSATDVLRAIDQLLPALDRLASFVSDAAAPALAGLTAATIAYAVTAIPAMSIALQAALPALLAKTTAMTGLAAATALAAAPFAVLAAAIGGATLVYQRWKNVSQDAVAMWEAQAGQMRDSADALGRYEMTSKGVQSALKDHAEQLRDLRDAQREEMLARADAARQGDKDAAWWEESNRRSNERLALIDQLSQQMDGYIEVAAAGTEADVRAAVAADRHAAAMRRLTDEAGLGESGLQGIESRMQALSAASSRGAQDAEALARAYAERRITTEQLQASLDALARSQEAAAEAARRQAEGDAAATAAAQQAAQAEAQRAAAAQLAYGDVEGALGTLRAAAALTEERVAELSKVLEDVANNGAATFGAVVAREATFLTEREAAFTTHQATMTELAAALAAATTESEYEAIAERMAAAEQSYAEQELRAAAAYAEQQAAQRAHLGQMLIDYVTAQAEMAGVESERIAEMTRQLADAYGVQVSLVDRSFSEMMGIADMWVAAGGENTDIYLADLGRITDETIALERETARIRGEMIAQARLDFEAGGLDAQGYATKLTSIEAEARTAAEALFGIPTRIESEVVVRTTRVESIGDWRAAERGSAPPRRTTTAPAAPRAAAAPRITAPAPRPVATPARRAAGGGGGRTAAAASPAATGRNEADEQARQLTASLEKARTAGAQAFDAVAAQETRFTADREAALRQHQARMAALMQALAEATTEAERESVQARIAEAEQSYAEQERTAAEAYARQQAAQRAHLGQMLIDYAVAQAQLAGIGADRIAEMTRKLADAYGVQQSIADRSFAAMTQSIDAWVAAGGESTESYLADLGRISEATIALQRETDRIRQEMIAQAQADYASGALSADQYADELSKIEQRAREAAEAALGVIPTAPAPAVTATAAPVLQAPAAAPTAVVSAPAAPAIPVGLVVSIADTLEAILDTIAMAIRPIEVAVTMPVTVNATGVDSEARVGQLSTRIAEATRATMEELLSSAADQIVRSQR